MSRLTVFADHDPATPLLSTEDPARIAESLAPIGVRFERWDSPVTPAEDASTEEVLALYKPYLDRLMGETGAGSADVVRLTPDHPQAAELRERFLAEHTHGEAEIRFFVRGAGHFVLHTEGRVLDVHCMVGDLIHVPAGIPHWFDAGPAPDFTALRVFEDSTGWVPHFTGLRLAETFPAA